MLLHRIDRGLTAPVNEIRGDPRSEFAQDLDGWFEINENFLIESFLTRKHKSGISLLSFNIIKL